ncbi:hypothetical protein [Desulfoscipio gibsoniae]
MSKQVDQQGIRYDRNENSLFNISDLAKAQELANNIESLKLCGRLDAIAHRVNPYLGRLHEILHQGYYWCVDQCKYATNTIFHSREELEMNTCQLFMTIMNGTFHINGFVNKDLRLILYPHSSDDRKARSKTTRLLKKLRAHGLIRKAPRSFKYYVSKEAGTLWQAFCI